jgi:hypothetical protein
MYRNKHRNGDMNEPSLIDFLKQHHAVANAESRQAFFDTRFFKMILSGDAKLPLDRVEEIADLLVCDRRQLFRMAMRQFYDEEAISTFERMLGNPLTDGEQQWLDIIRSASSEHVAEPSAMARRLLRALATPQSTV